MQNLKKLFYSALTCTFLLNSNLPANSTEKEVKVYSGRHYNTDRAVFKSFAEETGIKVRLIEAAGITSQSSSYSSALAEAAQELFT